jgi:hypothetical protein
MPTMKDKSPLVVVDAKTSDDELDNLPVDHHRMDGGTIAWLQVLGSWLIFINTW